MEIKVCNLHNTTTEYYVNSDEIFIKTIIMFEVLTYLWIPTGIKKIKKTKYSLSLLNTSDFSRMISYILKL